VNACTVKGVKTDLPARATFETRDVDFSHPLLEAGCSTNSDTNSFIGKRLDSEKMDLISPPAAFTIGTESGTVEVVRNVNTVREISRAIVNIVAVRVICLEII